MGGGWFVLWYPETGFWGLALFAMAWCGFVHPSSVWKKPLFGETFMYACSLLSIKQDCQL